MATTVLFVAFGWAPGEGGRWHDRYFWSNVGNTLQFVGLTVPLVTDGYIVDAGRAAEPGDPDNGRIAHDILMTNGGPGQQTQTLVRYIYQSAFRDNEMGMASAMAVILFFIIAAFSAMQFILGREKSS